MLKITVIPDAKKAMTYVSTLCMSAAAALVATWAFLDSDEKAALGPNVFHGVVVAILAFGIVGRFFKKIDPDAPQQDLVPQTMTPLEEKPIAVVTQSVPATPATAPADPATPKES